MQRLIFVDTINGNLTSDGTSTYTWDVRNRLAAITGPVPASFVYDATGRRARKTINGTVTDFLYDGVNSIQEVSGAGAASLLTGLGIDEYFARADTSEASALLTDALGSMVAQTDPSGAVQTQYTYEPFGQTSTTGAASSNPFQYTGRENDGPTGLYYYRARYYLPVLARFLSEDPLTCERRRAMNLYAYVANNPANLTDPSGLAPVGPEGCTYYDEICNKYRKGKGDLRDAYMCGAGQCCRDFGATGANTSCVRGCLIEQEQLCRAALPAGGIIGAATAASCRQGYHVNCYVRCGFYPWVNAPAVPPSCWGISTGF